MYSSINEKYQQPVIYRNDIYRKFELQFNTCFLNNINIEDNLYIEQTTNKYKKAFDVFLNAYSSDIKFFIGYTGVGKTTFLKHYFGYKTLGFVQYKTDGIVIPISWDGQKVSDSNYEQEIDEYISNLLNNLVEYIYQSYETIVLYESDELLRFINATRPNLIPSLSVYEVKTAQREGITIKQAKLQKSKEMHPVTFSSSLLKYVIATHRKDIKRLIFIVDDLETMAQSKLCYLITTYLNIYDCMHNTEHKPIVNLLFSLRPHSYRFLKDNIEHKYINCYGNFLENEANIIVKNDIPDVKEILIARFKSIFKQTEKPGNMETWRIAKEIFFEIIATIDDNIIKTISELCHLNIRAIIDCLQMILSNRVWCQYYTGSYTEHPNVRLADYKFDIVNVLRTLSCGEHPVYTGKKEVQFNQQNVSNILSRPRFDDSQVFIPNIFINLQNRRCDIFSIIVMQYLDGYFSSQNATPPNTEFIDTKTLKNNIRKTFGEYVSMEKIQETINYLFANRIIRKSIISKDSDKTLNILHDTDYVYLTLKGSRLLSMLESDSVLLEIYREDIKRNYENRDEYFKTSFELISANDRLILFEDLIELAKEIFNSEDDYQVHVGRKEFFYVLDYPITKKVLLGIENSLVRSQNINETDKKVLLHQLSIMKGQINFRINEIAEHIST